MPNQFDTPMEGRRGLTIIPRNGVYSVVSLEWNGRKYAEVGRGPGGIGSKATRAATPERLLALIEEVAEHNAALDDA